MNVSFSDGVGDEDRAYAGQIKTINVRRDIGFRLTLCRRLLRLFTSGETIEGKRFPSKIAIVSIKLAGTKVRSIKKDLQASGVFDINLAGRLFSGRLLPGCCRQDIA